MFERFNASNSIKDLPVGCCILRRCADQRFELLGVLVDYNYAVHVSDAMNVDGKSTFVVLHDDTRVFRKIFRKGKWYESLSAAAKG